MGTSYIQILIDTVCVVCHYCQIYILENFVVIIYIILENIIVIAGWRPSLILLRSREAFLSVGDLEGRSRLRLRLHCRGARIQFHHQPKGAFLGVVFVCVLLLN